MRIRLCSAAVVLLLVPGLVARPAGARREPPAAARAPTPNDAAPPGDATSAACDDAPGPAAAKVRVMLLDLTASGDLETTARSLGQVVATEAGRVEGFELISRAEIRTLLAEEAAKALLGCDESGCLAELAGAMDAGLLISGHLDRGPEGGAVLTMSLLNTRAVVTVNRVSLQWTGEDRSLPALARAATQLLVFERDRRPPAALTLQGLPADARVLINGEDRSAEATRGRIDGLDAGVYEVALDAPGFTPRAERVVLLAGESARIDGALEEAPLISTWWFWTGAGAALVAGAGVTAAALLVTGPADVTVSGQLRLPGLDDIERVKGGR